MRVRSSQIQKEDPFEELIEVYAKMEELEKKFSRVLSICQFMVQKNKELNEKLDKAAKEELQFKQKATAKLSREEDLLSDIKRYKTDNNGLQEHIRELTLKNQEIMEDLDAKNELISMLKVQ